MIYRRMKEDIGSSLYGVGDICPLINSGKGQWLIPGAKKHNGLYVTQETLDESFEAADIEETEAQRWLIEQNMTATEMPAMALPAASADNMVALQQSNSAAELRNASFALQKQAEGVIARIGRASSFLESFSNARLQEANAKMAEVKAYTDKLMEVVHTVNLYLGRDEEIACLQEGEPAPASEPISLRARVLFMEEECALDHPEGIDYAKIHFFDEWIKKPENLNLVLPEKKGVVVLQPTRKSREYEGVDPYTHALLNHENAKSYWLIRNGDRLHRFWADIRVGEELFPQRQGGPLEAEHSRPGSEEFYTKMDRSPADQKHFFKIALTLQGLMDRTRLFMPFQDGQKPNLLDPGTYGTAMRFIYDANPALGEGRAPFQEWLNDANRRMSAGMRVVGVWRGGEVYPKSAYGHHSEETRTLEHDSRGFIFRFDQQYTTRQGTYAIDMEQDAFLCLDQLKIEDIDYYLRSRETRTSYRNMVPLLQQARAVILEEQKVETPFRALMLGELRKIRGQATEQDVEGMVTWWKTKNQAFRPIIGTQETAALNDIRTRFGKFSTDGDKVLEAVEALLPAPALMVWRDGPKISALTAQNNEQVFVRKFDFEWKARQGKAEMIRSNDWHFFPNGVLHEPEILKSDKERINTWRIGANHYQHLSDPDVEILVDYLQKRHSKYHPLFVTRSYGPNNREETVTVEMLHDRDERSGRNDRSEPENRTYRVKWTRKGAKPSFDVVSQSSKSMWIGGGEKGVHYPWSPSGLRHDDVIPTAAIPEIGVPWNSQHARAPRLLYVDRELCALTEKEYLAHQQEWAEKQEKLSFLSSQEKDMEGKLLEEWQAKEQQRYVDQGGNMEHWDSHYKTLKQPDIELGEMRRVLHTALDTAGPDDLEGKTWPEILALTKHDDPLASFSINFRMARPPAAICVAEVPEVPSLDGVNRLQAAASDKTAASKIEH
jgi:hypothetical protein